MGVHLGLLKLTGENLQAGDFEIVINVLWVGINRLLIDFHSLNVFTFFSKRVRFGDVGFGSRVGVGVGTKGGLIIGTTTIFR